MNLKILSKNNNLYSTNAIVQAAIKRKHYVQVIDPSLCELTIGDPTKLTARGQKISKATAIIPRIGATHTLSGSYTIRQFEQLGSYSLISSEALLASRDKWKSLQRINQAKIPIPKSIFIDNPCNFEYIFENFKFPVILKLLESTHGKGVILVENPIGLKTCLETFTQLNQAVLIQEFISEAQNKDIRVIVLGNEVIAAMEREGQKGDFRSNLHIGGSARPISLTLEEKQIAIKATKVLGLEFAGVDLLRSNRGSLVLEINSSPGLEGIENCTGIDIAKEMIKYIEKQILK